MAVSYPDNNGVLFDVRLFKSHEPKQLLVEFHRQSGPRTLLLVFVWCFDCRLIVVCRVVLSFRRYFNKTIEQLGDVVQRVLYVSSLAELAKQEIERKQTTAKTAVKHDPRLPYVSLCSLPSVPAHMFYQPIPLPLMSLTHKATAHGQPPEPQQLQTQMQQQSRGHGHTHKREPKTAPSVQSGAQTTVADDASASGEGDDGGSGDGNGGCSNKLGAKHNTTAKPTTAADSDLPPLSSLQPMPTISRCPRIASVTASVKAVVGFTPCAMHLEKDNDELNKTACSQLWYTDLTLSFHLLIVLAAAGSACSADVRCAGCWRCQR